MQQHPMIINGLTKKRQNKRANGVFKLIVVLSINQLKLKNNKKPLILK